MTRPLAIDLFTGLHGWTEGFINQGWRVVGYDIEDMSAQHNETKPNHFELVLQDVRTLHGSQFANADCIVASPPCQEFSYLAMPWSRGKQIVRALRGQDEFPIGYNGSRTIQEMRALFDACFRIQSEAIAARGSHIPLIVENVRGAQSWVGHARWSWGSYYLWGDVPALMPQRLGSLKNPGFRFDGSGKSFQTESVERHVEGIKQPGISGRRNNGKGDAWFQDGAARSGSKSPARKAASAKIAKIPFALSSWIARTHKPDFAEDAA